jgi:hypothetical protein
MTSRIKSAEAFAQLEAAAAGDRAAQAGTTLWTEDADGVWHMAEPAEPRDMLALLPDDDVLPPF